MRSLRASLEADAGVTGVRFFEDADSALEKDENALLARMTRMSDGAKYALARLDILKGLSTREYRLLEQVVSSFQYAAGERIVREGDEANALFIIARGSASISITVEGGRRKRVGSVGPGFSIGEMALVEGGRRSADVHADEPVICYALSIDRLKALSVEHPNVMITILSNIVASLSHRLRHANQEIRSLE
jgi:glutaminase